MSSSQRIEWLDALRGFALFFVIWGHVSATSRDIDILIYSFHMPLFFMISGATFRPGKYDSFRACVIDKAKKLLIPYVLLYLINVPFWYINKKILGSNSTPVIDVIMGIFSSNQKIDPMSSGALWFLPTLFLISILFYGLVELDKKGKLKLEASVVILLMLGLYLGDSFEAISVWHWASVPMGTVFYYLGWMFIQNYQNIIGAISGKERQNNPYSQSARFAIVTIALFALGFWAAEVNGKISMHHNEYHTIALALVSSLGISLALTMLMMKLPKIKLLDYAGKNSLAFFGFHVAVLRFLENFPYTEAFAESHALLTAIAVFLLLVPISMFINKFCPFIVAKKYKKKATA